MTLRLLQRLSSSGRQHLVSALREDEAALRAQSVAVLNVDDEPDLRFRSLHISADASESLQVVLAN